MADLTAVVVPRMNTNDDQAVLVKWLVESGAAVKGEQPVAVMETTKTAFEVNAARDGYIFYELGAATMVDVGASIAWISDSATPPAIGAAKASSGSESAAQTAAIGSDERFSRKALRLMRDHGLAVADFPGTERVEIAQVQALVEQRASGSAAPKAAGKVSAEPSDARALEQVPSKLLEARALERVYRQVVPSTVVVAVDEARLQARLQAQAQKEGVVSALELTIFEAAKLLAEFPALNGYYANGSAYTYGHVAIGFAINAGGRSLKVPVIRDCNVTSALQIARGLRDLSLKYMREELVMEDVIGGTFTVTDLSAQGVVNFIPVINERQSAILGICAERPGTGTRDLVLTFDHRMSDGMQGAEFLSQLRDALAG
jgi:pyruvate/2-oxoglutarate dehydrogenase complex dihydrolipoamide acyltransferase (E2) component